MGLSPVVFAESLVDFELDAWQCDALQSDAPRMLWNIHRQGGKSTVAAILALHRVVFIPDSLVLLISPSLRQSGELFKKVVAGLRLLPDMPKLEEDNRTSFQLPNGSRVVSLPGHEATVRGFSGVDLIIEDEAARVSDDLYIACRPMVAVSGGRLILLSTPFGKRGHFHAEWTGGSKAWHRVEVPVTQTRRIPAEFLEEEKGSMGQSAFDQEYNCVFAETLDQVFGLELVLSALKPEVQPFFGGWRAGGSA
jgi:hypothetical protein